MQDVDSIDVGHEAPTAEQKAAILDAPKGGTDTLVIGAYCNSSSTNL